MSLPYVSKKIAKFHPSSYEEEYLCSLAYRSKDPKLYYVLETLIFWDKDHCKTSFLRYWFENDPEV